MKSTESQKPHAFIPYREQVLSALRSSVDDMRHVYEMTLFGSFASPRIQGEDQRTLPSDVGQNHPNPESDIDGCMYVEIDDLAKETDQDSQSLYHQIPSGISSPSPILQGTHLMHRSYEWELKKDLEIEYRSKLSDLLAQKLGRKLPDHVVQDVSVFPISLDIIDGELHLLEQNAQSLLSLKGSKDIDHMAPPFPSRMLAGLFYYPLDAQRDHYRRYVLSRLKSMRKCGELIWIGIAFQVSIFFSGDKNFSIPKTLNSALKATKS
ncbi:MAG: hypothetical protein WCG83_03805 [Candidatus Peregrinibacteria bacterium]